LETSDQDVARKADGDPAACAILGVDSDLAGRLKGVAGVSSMVHILDHYLLFNFRAFYTHEENRQ
jgi:hypothetical protein